MDGGAHCAAASRRTTPSSPVTSPPPPLGSSSMGGLLTPLPSSTTPLTLVPATQIGLKVELRDSRDHIGLATSDMMRMKAAQEEHDHREKPPRDEGKRTSGHRCCWKELIRAAGLLNKDIRGRTGG